MSILMSIHYVLYDNDGHPNQIILNKVYNLSSTAASKEYRSFNGCMEC